MKRMHFFPQSFALFTNDLYHILMKFKCKPLALAKAASKVNYSIKCFLCAVVATTKAARAQHRHETKCINIG